MAHYSNDTGNALPASQASINDSRRIFNFGERVAELAPQQSPFFVYLSKVAKQATDDPVFKFLEQRHQFQRRNFIVKTDGAATAKDASVTYDVVCEYDKFGNDLTLGGGSSTAAPQFLLVNQVIRVGGKALKITAVTPGDGASGTYASGTASTHTEIVCTALEAIAESDVEVGTKGQVIGSAWAEGSTDPDGWKDELFSREGYCQIFKTSVQLFSGSALATRYRGRPDEYKRVWADKLMEHKMDIEHAMLFGVGASDESASGGPVRYTHGIVPYTEANGNVFNFTYASTDYDAFIDAMKDFLLQNLETVETN